MSVTDALLVMIAFASFLVDLIGLVIVIITLKDK
ncbi:MULTISPECIES: putative holin-like toxin [Streptococcus]|nr:MULTISPECIES: putative holin-like toxin [Streptococcus]